jgi:hypothetical protein
LPGRTTADLYVVAGEFVALTAFLTAAYALPTIALETFTRGVSRARQSHNDDQRP